jgi:phage shock protein A
MKRLWNLFVGWFNQYIYALEAESPEVVYDNAINQVIESYKLLKQKAAAVVRRADELKTETEATQKSLTKVNQLLESAAYLPENEVDYEAAAEMVSTQEQLKEKLTGLLEDLAVAQSDVKDVTAALQEVESEKRKLVAEKDANIGRFRSAQARLAVMERQDGTSIDAINQSLTGVRGNIKNTIAEANLTKQLQSNTLENKVKAFTKATEGQSAKQKFMQMREAAKQQSAGAGVLTEVLEAKQTPELVSATKTETKTA